MKNEKNDFTGTQKEAYEQGIHFAHNQIEARRDGADRAIFWESEYGEDYGVLSLTEAQELIEVLQAIIADYPKEPTNEEILNELPVGSVVQAYTNVNFLRANLGWFSPMGFLYSSKRLAQEDFTVKLRGPEDGGDE